MENTRFSLPRTYTRKLLKAIREFGLIQPGDRVLVGFSGGKDSSFLLYALSIFQKHQIIPFDLGALTVDLGFEKPFDENPLRWFCEQLNVPFWTMKTGIAKYAFGEANPEGPCATCSFLRRGAMNRFALEHDYNTIALAHHHDDAVETFLMSIIFSGQIKTFLPRTVLDRTGITVIRPLVYFREAEIRRAKELTGFQPIPSPCPANGLTKRAETKELIRRLSRNDKNIFNNLASAIREGRPMELWPPELSQEEKRRRIWGKNE
ncbi:MAG: tRNA 2-thiocytidine biosynthesis TtcA family protein [Firmicutes bacterium]|nr:tRNA 2-thiocytidine biosynthesis TtcA family protein [Bacillota bacterium]